MLYRMCWWWSFVSQLCCGGSGSVAPERPLMPREIAGHAPRVGIDYWGLSLG